MVERRRWNFVVSHKRKTWIRWPHVDSRQTSQPALFRARQTHPGSPAGVNQSCVDSSQHSHATCCQKTLSLREKKQSKRVV